MDTPPHLLHFRISHFNEKVRWALDHKGWPHTRASFVPGFHVLRARRLTGQSRLPILLLDGRALNDSTAIIAELERLRPDPPLYPTDPAERERALAIEHWFDEEVAPPLRRLFWSTYLGDSDACARMATDGAGLAERVAFRALFFALRPAMKRNMQVAPDTLSRARVRLDEAIDRIERELGARRFLVGDRFSIADLTAAAVMTAILRPPQFPYPLPEPWPRALVEIRDSVIDRRGCRWVMELYAQERAPSAELVRAA